MSPVAKGNEVRVRGWGRRREGGRRGRETLEHKTQRQMKQARCVHTGTCLEAGYKRMDVL